MLVKVGGFVVLGALGATVLLPDQVRQKGTTGPVPQAQNPQAVALPHPEIVPIRYEPPTASRPGKLVVRAWNPSFDSSYASTRNVTLKVRDLAGKVQTEQPSLSVPSVSRLNQVDLTFNLTIPRPGLRRVGLGQARPAPTLALSGINLQAETIAPGQTTGPTQPLLRWPQNEAYDHVPLNVHGTWSQNATLTGSSSGSSGSPAMRSIEEEHLVLRASSNLALKSSVGSDSTGDPPPTSVLQGTFLADSRFDGTDTNIAVGPSAVLITNSGSFAFTDRAGQSLRSSGGSQVLEYSSVTSLFAPLAADIRANMRLPQEAVDAGYDKINFYDTRSAYDPYRNRFWILCLVHNKWNFPATPASNQNYRRNKVACAVSKSSDPRDGFWLYWWDGAPFDGQPGTDWLPGDRADYPSIGISPKFLMQNSQVPNLPPTGANQYSRQSLNVLLNADALAAGRAQFGWMFHKLNDHTGAMINYVATPATHYGPSPNNRAYLLKRLGTTMLVYGFDAHVDFPKAPRLVTFPVRDASEIKLMDQKSSADASNPPQIKLDITPIPMKVVVRNSRMWSVMPEAVQWGGTSKVEGAVRYFRANLASFANNSIPTTTQSGFIERTFGKRNKADATTDVFGYGMPNLDVDSNGNAIIGYLRSGLSIFCEARLSVGYASESDVRPSLQLMAGQGTLTDSESQGDGSYGQLDCTGAALDPDGKTVWLAMPFAWRANNSSTKAQYRIVVARVKL